jgi:hypothetical protein
MILVVLTRAALAKIGRFRTTGTALGGAAGKKLSRCFPSVEWLENRLNGKHLDPTVHFHGNGSGVYWRLAAGR